MLYDIYQGLVPLNKLYEMYMHGTTVYAVQDRYDLHFIFDIMSDMKLFVLCSCTVLVEIYQND